MKRAKPSWTVTNVTWETKKVIWRHWAAGETTSETVRYFEKHIDNNAVYSRHTIGKVKDELTKLPVSKLIQLVSELPEIEDFVEELRHDYIEQKAHEKEQKSRHSEELKTTALIIASNLEKLHNAPLKSSGDPLRRTWLYTVGELVYGGWWIHDNVFGRLGNVDKPLAIELLQILKEEGDFPELTDIQDWADLKEDDNTEDFIQRLNSRAHRGNF